MDFPVVGLNFENVVLGKCAESPTYDLYAVINHSGTLGTGHYYTYAKNREDMNWYWFNDSQVTLLEDADQVVTNNAYLLFYFKNSVEEFQRQTLKSDQNIAEKKITPRQSKIVFQKALKNTLTKKFTQHVNPDSKEASPKSESQVISVIQDSRLDSSYLPEDSKVIGRRKSKRATRKKSVTNNSSHLKEEEVSERQRHIYDQNKEVKLKYLKSKSKKSIKIAHHLHP